MRLLVIIPTYNELDNIKKLIPDVVSMLPEGGGILVVDDASPDGTAVVVKEFCEHYKDTVNLLERSGKNGLASAYIDGFNWGIEHGFDVLCEMDADFSHKPEYLPTLYAAIQNHDVAVGSRNIAGGRVENWSFLRNCISKGGSLYSRIVLGVHVKDLTGGFNMWRKEALDRIGLDSITSKGYSFQIEMKAKAEKRGCSIKEIPIVFPDRVHGQSKMSRGIFMEALVSVWKLRLSLQKINS